LELGAWSLELAGNFIAAVLFMVKGGHHEITKSPPALITSGLFYVEGKASLPISPIAIEKSGVLIIHKKNASK